MKSDELNHLALEACRMEFETSLEILKAAALKGEMNVRLYNLSSGTIILLNKHGFQISGPRRSVLGKRVYTVGFNKNSVL
jgi:hypothetical protein